MQDTLPPPQLTLRCPQDKVWVPSLHPAHLLCPCTDASGLQLSPILCPVWSLCLEALSLLPSSFTWSARLWWGPLTLGLCSRERGSALTGDQQLEKQKLSGRLYRGLRGWGRRGCSGKLPHKRLCRATRQFVSEPCSCLGHFHFYLLRVVSRSWQAGDVMLMTPAPRGDHSGKSCNVLSATLIRETHQELLHGDSFPPSTCPAC